MKNNWKINTSNPITYSISQIENMFDVDNTGLIDYIGDLKQKKLLVIDVNVATHYFTRITQYFEANNIPYQSVLLDGGECNKSVENLFILLEKMENFGLNRRDISLIGIGGGVVLDLVGLAASMYRRGIPYLRIPTTLLGIVDVSVAAKTGINYMTRRNRLGSYYPPIASLLDTTFLPTLKPIEISSGLGEIIKIGVIADLDLFNILYNFGDILYNNNFNHHTSHEVIHRAISVMKNQLEHNLWETDLKRSMDFGHSFSPIIEMRSLETDDVPSLSHGHAVAIDILFSCCLSYKRGYLTKEDLDKVYETSKKLGLPTDHPMFYDINILWESLSDTVKHRNGNQNLPIPNGLGSHIFLNDVTFDEVITIINIFKDINEK